MVGSPQVINCTVSTVSGVESSSVMISWRGPGNIATSDGRIFSIGSVTDDGNNMYTRSLQFTYLMERDEGTYTCNVMILETSGSQSVELQSLTGMLLRITQLKYVSICSHYNLHYSFTHLSMLLPYKIVQYIRKYPQLIHSIFKAFSYGTAQLQLHFNTRLHAWYHDKITWRPVTC